jgi:hypothetical protein
MYVEPHIYMLIPVMLMTRSSLDVRFFLFWIACYPLLTHGR